MNSPSHENIDLWLFDHIEGNLSLEQEEALRLFLLLNPSYDIDLDAWEKSKVDFPEIDPVLVESMGFGTTPQEKKRKKRPVGLWILSSGFLIIILGLIGISIIDSPTQSTKNKLKTTLSQTSASTFLKSNSKRKLSNQTSTNAYPTAYMTKRQRTIHSTINGVYVSGLDNLLQPYAFSAQDIDPSLSSTADLKPTCINSISLHIAGRNCINQVLASDLIQTNQSDVVKEKKNVSFHLPSLKISKSSSLSKYLRKEVLSATQKDRVYFMQEQSHLDISDAFAGNRSQTRFQTTSIGRWIGDGNQKLTQQLSIDGYSRNLKSGFGMVANYTDFGNGAIKEWNIRLIYSPKIAVGRYLSIEPSISYVFGQKTLNAAKTTSLSSFEYSTNYAQQFNYDLSKPIGDHLLYRDLNMGLNLNLGPVYLGMSTQNLLKHQDNIHTNKYDTITRANRTSTFFIGTDFSAKKGEIMFSPMLSHSIGATKNLTQLGATIQVKGIVIGGNYGSNSSVGALVGYQAKNFSLIAQSLKVKPLTSNNPLYIHQLTLRINTNISRKTRRYLYL